MRAKSINEFEQNGNPYQSLGLGKIAEADKKLKNAIDMHFTYKIHDLNNIEIVATQDTIDSIKREESKEYFKNYSRFIQYIEYKKFYIEDSTTSDGSWQDNKYYAWNVLEKIPNEHYALSGHSNNTDIWGEPKFKTKISYDNRRNISSEQAKIEAQLIADAFNEYYGTGWGFISKE